MIQAYLKVWLYFSPFGWGCCWTWFELVVTFL